MKKPLLFVLLIVINLYAAAQMVEAIVKDQHRILPVCIQLDGEYGIKNCYLGVPVVLGKTEWRKLLNWI